MPMHQEHPVSKDLERFLHNTSHAADSKQRDFLVRHLLAECTTCREHFQQSGWSDARLKRLLSLPGSDELASPPLDLHYDYDQAFAGSERKIDDFLATDRPLAMPLEELLSELQAPPESEQRRRA